MCTFFSLEIKGPSRYQLSIKFSKLLWIKLNFSLNNLILLQESVTIVAQTAAIPSFFIQIMFVFQ
ncbi:hypothetical protein DR092_01050 [Mycoplasma hyorhinis]|nr:hypothetical protein [Mesomycoplasma hyorhinis]